MKTIRPLFRAASAIAAISLLLFTELLCAQQLVSDVDSRRPATCGWSSWEAVPIPAVIIRLEQLLGEAGEGYVTEAAREGLEHLKRWVVECDEVEARFAVQSLRRAHDRDSSNPVVRAALGVALARGRDVQLPGAEGHNFRPAAQQSNAERDARRLLPRALEALPIPEVAMELAAMALATRDETSLDVAAGALERVTATLPGSATAWTARAEVALARHEYDEAIQASTRAAELGDASGLRALGVAHLIRDADPADGARIYMEGLSSADPPAVYRYREDLAPLLLFDEVKEWAGLHPAQRVSWLRDAWEWRASTAGRTVAERLAIHFRRLDTAIGQYRRMAHYGARPNEAIVRDSLQLGLPYDDRGLIYIRHGDPDDIVRAPSGRMGPGREAWLYYGLVGGRAVFEFRRFRDWSDWVAAPVGECDPFVYMYGKGGPVGEAMYLANERPDIAWFEEFQRGVYDWGMKLANVDPALGMNAARCTAIVSTARRENPVLQGGTRTVLSDRLRIELPYIRLSEASRRRFSRAAVDEALSTEGAVPRFGRPFQALSSVYALKADEEGASVAAFLLLPAGNLTPRRLDGSVAYNLRLSLAIEDNGERRVQRLDTVLTFVAAEPIAAGQHMRIALMMPATPVAHSTVRVTVVNADHPDEGQMLVGTKSIPGYAAGTLAMSDLVVAEQGSGTWRRGEVAISPVPGHQIQAGSGFRLFYELYGTRPHERLRTRITIAPGTGPDLLSRLRSVFGEQRVVELSFSEDAQPGPDGTLQVERTVTPSLEPGRYRLLVTIEQLDGGASVSMETSILLLGPAPGG